MASDLRRCLGQRLRHAQRAPDQRHHAIQHQHDEDAAPLRQQQHGLPERRRDHGHGDEHHHRQRHHARHATAGIAVAHDRGRDHAGGRGAEALQRPRQQQRLERGGRDRKQAGDTIDRHAAEQQRTATEPVRQRPHHELADAEAEQEDRQHHLRPVGGRDVEGGRDVRQRRQHHVHRDRIERHDRRDHDHEFGEAHRAVA